ARDGWVEEAFEWLGTLAAAGVPVTAIDDPVHDDGAGLLLVPRPETALEAIERAHAAGRPVLTGPAPAFAPQRLAAVRDALGALVRPDLRGVLVLRLDDPGAAVRRHLRWWRHEAVAPPARQALWGSLRGFGRMS